MAILAALQFHRTIASLPGSHFREKIRSALHDGRHHAVGRFRPVDRHGHDRRADRRSPARAPSDVGGIQVPDTTKAKAVITQELIDRQAPGQTILNVDQPRPRRELHQLRPVRQLGRQHPHPRLRRQPHQPDLRRRSAQRQRQLRDLLEPAARPRADRAGQRRPRRDRRRLADRFGRRRHRQLPHDRPHQTTWARACRGSLGDCDYHRLFGMFNTGEFTPWGTKAWIAASHAQNDKFKGPGEINKYQFNARIYQPLGIERRLHLDRRPLQPQPQQLLSQPEQQRPARLPRQRPRSSTTPVRPPTIRSRSATSTSDQINQVMAFDNLGIAAT